MFFSVYPKLFSTGNKNYNDIICPQGESYGCIQRIGCYLCSSSLLGNWFCNSRKLTARDAVSQRADHMARAEDSGRKDVSTLSFVSMS